MKSVTLIAGHKGYIDLRALVNYEPEQTNRMSCANVGVRLTHRFAR